MRVIDSGLFRCVLETGKKNQFVDYTPRFSTGNDWNSIFQLFSSNFRQKDKNFFLSFLEHKFKNNLNSSNLVFVLFFGKYFRNSNNVLSYV